MKRNIVLSIVVFGSIGISHGAHADVEGAKKYIAEVKKLIADGDTKDVGIKLDLADAELDGVTGADKDAAASEIKQLRANLAGAANAEALAEARKNLAYQLKQAEENLGSKDGFESVSKDLEDLLASDSGKLLPAGEVETARKKMVVYKKVMLKKNGERIAEQLKRDLDNLEKEWPEQKQAIEKAESPNSKDSAIESAGRNVERVQKQLDGFPDDQPAAANFKKRFAKVNDEYMRLALADKVKEEVETLKRGWDSYAEDFKGWQSEGDGPTFTQYKSEQSEKISAFNAPHSRELVSRFESLMKNWNESETYNQVKNAPEVKKLIEEYQAIRNAAYTKLLKSAQSLVDQGVKAKLDENTTNALGRLRDDVRLALGMNDQNTLILQARIDAVLKKQEQATAGAAAAADEWYKKISAASSENWDKIKAGLTAEEGFDPQQPAAFKGKVISFETDNLMGYRFKPGDFKFATTLSGFPVACKYDPVVAAAIKIVEDKMGRSLGDNDNDGKWTVYAVVTGSKGRLMQKKQAEGDVKVDGEKVGTVTTEYAEPVDAPILTIIAAHCGPLCVSKDKGMVMEDGSIGKP